MSQKVPNLIVSNFKLIYLLFYKSTVFHKTRSDFDNNRADICWDHKAQSGAYIAYV